MPRTYKDRTKLQAQAAAIANVQRACARYLAAFGLPEDRALEVVIAAKDDEAPTIDAVFGELDLCLELELGRKPEVEGQTTLEEHLEKPGILEHVEGLATIDDAMAVLEYGRKWGADGSEEVDNG